jgi:hypothetical protein
MTTIAYRDGVMASDTGMTMRGSRCGRATKIVRASDGRLIGACGSCSGAEAFKTWALDPNYRDYEPPANPIKDEQPDWSGLIAHPDGQIEVFDGGESSHKFAADYYAAGSGRPEALGAMFMGATAEQAVRAAMAHDHGTWGDVLTLRHAEPLREAAE